MIWSRQLRTLISLLTVKNLISSATCDDGASDAFLQMFLAKRMEQLQAVKNILLLDVSKQNSFLEQITAKIQDVMSRHKVNLENAGYIPGDEFPTDLDIRESFSLILENSCLFCDIALRLPDEIDKRMSARRELQLTIRWAVGYVKDLQLIDESTRKLLNLCAQEIKLVDRDPDFHNPYRMRKVQQKRFEDPPVPPKKERKKLKRGPKMSRTEL